MISEQNLELENHLLVKKLAGQKVQLKCLKKVSQPKRNVYVAPVCMKCVSGGKFVE